MCRGLAQECQKRRTFVAAPAHATCPSVAHSPAEPVHAGCNRWALQQIQADGAPAYGAGSPLRLHSFGHHAGRLPLASCLWNMGGSPRCLPLTPHRVPPALNIDKRHIAQLTALQATHSSSGATSEWSVGASQPAPSAARRRRRSAAPSPNMGSFTSRSRGLSTPPAGGVLGEDEIRRCVPHPLQGCSATQGCSAADVMGGSDRTGCWAGGIADARSSQTEQRADHRPSHRMAAILPGATPTAAHAAHGQQQRHDLQQMLVDLCIAQGAVLRKQRLGRLVRLH